MTAHCTVKFYVSDYAVKLEARYCVTFSVTETTAKIGHNAKKAQPLQQAMDTADNSSKLSYMSHSSHLQHLAKLCRDANAKCNKCTFVNGKNWMYNPQDIPYVESSVEHVGLLQSIQLCFGIPQLIVHTVSTHHIHALQLLYEKLTDSISNKNMWSSPILVTERWARSWSWYTCSQPASDFLSHISGGRLPLLFARAAEERHRSSTSTKLYCLVTST